MAPTTSRPAPLGACLAASVALVVAALAMPWRPALAAAPPDPPTAVTATPGLLSASVSWTAPTNTGGLPIDHYTVTSSPDNVAVQSATTSATVSGLKGWTPDAPTSYTFTVTATTSAGASGASAASTAVSPVLGGSFHPLTPTRILDTRTGTGVPAGGRGPLGANSTLSTQLLGRAGVPASGVSAVLLNVTVTDTTADGYLTVYPSTVAQPPTSNLNWVAGQTIANMAEVTMAGGQQLTAYNFAGSADVIFDVQGWVGDAANSTGSAGLENPMPPSRLMDTRNGTGGPLQPFGQGETRNLQVTGQGGVPASGVSAVIMNVTVTNATSSGFLTLFPAGSGRPLASSLNWAPGQTIPNRVQMPVGSNGQISVYNAFGSADVVIDVSGWFTDGSARASGSYFAGQAPTRIEDSRTVNRVLDRGATDFIYVTYTHVHAVVWNVTLTWTNAPSFLTLYPSGSPRPTASDLNWDGGQTVTNFSIPMMGRDSNIQDDPPAVTFYVPNDSPAVILDQYGFYGDPVTVDPAAAAVRHAAAPSHGAAPRGPIARG